MIISSQTNILCGIQYSYLQFSRKVSFCSIWNANRTFLAERLLCGMSYLVTMETHIHVVFIKKWIKVGKIISGSLHLKQSGNFYIQCTLHIVATFGHPFLATISDWPLYPT